MTQKELLDELDTFAVALHTHVQQMGKLLPSAEEVAAVGVGGQITPSWNLDTIVELVTQVAQIEMGLINILIKAQV